VEEGAGASCSPDGSPLTLIHESRGGGPWSFAKNILEPWYPVPMASPAQHTMLLARVQAGETEAAAELLGVVYEELRGLAASYMAGQGPGHTLQPTALVHEAFIKLVDRTSPHYSGRGHFFAVAATAMRQILVDHARAENAQKRGGGRTRVSLEEGLAPSGGGSVIDVVALDEALKTLGELDERQAKIVEMRFFAGLTVDEVAAVLGVSRSTVEEEWRMARAWLSRRLGPGQGPA
jgi:RNA polymerase sigma-70 factor (ECF subfamily)